MNTPGNITPAKNVSPEEALDVRRRAVQREMELHRKQMQRQWRPVDERGEPIEEGHFPRSAIMRFLCGGKAAALVSKVVAWQFVRRYPNLVFWEK